jgi:hypothetical protein
MDGSILEQQLTAEQLIGSSTASHERQLTAERLIHASTDDSRVATDKWRLTTDDARLIGS